MAHKNKKPYLKIITKKIVWLLLIANIGLVQAQYTAIPDPIFEQYLIDFDIDSDGIINGQILTSDIDFRTNLQINETAPNYPITNLTGIQDFTSLEHAEIYFTELENIDFGYLTNLTYLQCLSNPNLVSVNVSQCINIETLSLLGNSLSIINLPQTQSLELFECISNQLTNLDLSQYSNLINISVQNNLLEYLNVANSNNIAITSFNALNNPNLQCILVDDTAYSTANWTNIDPTTTFVETQEECDALSVNEFNLDIFKIYPNPANNYIVIESIQPINDIKIFDLSGKLVKTFNSQSLKYNISNLSKGIYIIEIKTHLELKIQKLIIE
jgi:hypothetical protein